MRSAKPDEAFCASGIVHTMREIRHRSYHTCKTAATTTYISARLPMNSGGFAGRMTNGGGGGTPHLRGLRGVGGDPPSQVKAGEGVPPHPPPPSGRFRQHDSVGDSTRNAG